ncbi:hypothetical protein R1flu_013838 [Riccia fluitans]|uniref:Uncharacterized protein n=1 Tax=Riccia fluitans TaxID=41844 RepID=A0ABD1YI37_9MARC
MYSAEKLSVSTFVPQRPGQLTDQGGSGAVRGFANSKGILAFRRGGGGITSVAKQWLRWTPERHELCFGRMGKPMISGAQKGLVKVRISDCSDLFCSATFSGSDVRNIRNWKKNCCIVRNENEKGEGRRFRLRGRQNSGSSCTSSGCGKWKFAGDSFGQLRIRARRRKGGKVMAFWLTGQDDVIDEEISEFDEIYTDEVGPLTSIGDFTRFMDNGDDGAELQTAIVTYRKPWPWNILSRTQVDLVAAVHIADKKFFGNLQEELVSYDRVLYEMVADKNPRLSNRNAKNRWRPPKRRGKAGFSIIGTIQRIMARVLTLDFQLECMDYRRDNWFHADLDYETFQKLQSERGETFFSFAKDLTEISSKTLFKNLSVSSDMKPWRSKLLWVARVFPMPLLGLVVIESVCAPSNAPLQQSPEMKALLQLDLASALKVYLAKQITTDLTDGASTLVENSVIIGERNKVAMEELQEAVRDGCKKIAIFYGSGHLPDMHARLTRDFGLVATEIQWRTAWYIQSRKTIREGALTSFLRNLAEVSGWPLNRYQTLALLFLSGVLAIDLWFWELLLGGVIDYSEQTIVFVVNFLEQGWNL